MLIIQACRVVQTDISSDVQHEAWLGEHNEITTLNPHSKKKA